jgi:hypothetical protein
MLTTVLLVAILIALTLVLIHLYNETQKRASVVIVPEIEERIRDPWLYAPPWFLYGERTRRYPHPRRRHHRHPHPHPHP